MKAFVILFIVFNFGTIVVESSVPSHHSDWHSQCPLLTVAIPTYKCWDRFLSKSFPLFIKNPYVWNVVVCDETGEDIDAIIKSGERSSKMMLYQNPARLGATLNKRQCMELAPTEWVALLDCDNKFEESFFSTLFDIWFREGLIESHLYTAANPQFIDVDRDNFESYPLERFGELMINRSNWNSMLRQPMISWILNEGNWVLHQSAANFIPEKSADTDEIVLVDALYTLHLLVKNGGFTLDTRRALHYTHYVHADSYFADNMKHFVKIITTNNWIV